MGERQQAAEAVAGLSVVDHLKEDFLVGNRIHQSVRAEQQEIALLPLHRKGIRVGFSLGPQRAGDQIALGMVAGCFQR